jgi:DNA-binding transcriptional ArsR family regulator
VVLELECRVRLPGTSRWLDPRYKGCPAVWDNTMVDRLDHLDLRRAAKAMEVLGDRHRLQIIRLLTLRERCAGDLVATLGLEQSLVSYHLRRLRAVKVVRTRRDGTLIFYSINPEGWEHFTQPIRDLTESLIPPLSAAPGCETVQEITHRG